MKARAPMLVAFLVPFAVAVGARALLVLTVLLIEDGCDLSAYASAADGRQLLAMAEAWRGDLDVVREARFFKELSASGGLGSSHLIRFLAAPAVVAAGQAMGGTAAVAATVPFWIVAGLAAGLTGVWLGDWRAGVLVTAMPPILLYSTSFCDSMGWLHAAGVGTLLLARDQRWMAAGATAGLACWARPEGIFILAAATLACRRRLAALGRLLLGAVVIATIGAAVMVSRLGPLLAEALVGGGADGSPRPGFIDLPGRALLQGMTSASTPTWKLPYVGAHLALVVGAGWLLWRRARSATAAGSPVEQREALMLVTWIVLQLAFVLCLGGSQGFDDLPRYVSIAFPAVVAAYFPLLPRSPAVIAAACAASLAIATIPARKNTRPECPPAHELERHAHELAPDPATARTLGTHTRVEVFRRHRTAGAARSVT